MKLRPEYTSQFARDVKRLVKKRIDTAPLYELVDLILKNTPESLRVLRQRHNMHQLRGEWRGSHECHIANAGDWLLIWVTSETLAVFQRTGTHDQLFRK